MNFSTELNHYIEQLHCSSKELSEASNLSETTISRYRSGERIPTAKSKQMIQLAHGLSSLAYAKNLPGLEEENLYKVFESLLPIAQLDYNEFFHRLNLLFDLLEVKSSVLAKALNYDSSYISRIRSGQRKPSHLLNFLDQICNYIVRHYDSTSDKYKIEKLIGCKPEDLSDSQKYKMQLIHWFHQESTLSKNDVEHFLQTMNEFDLDQYIDAIHFNEIKLPNVPFQLHLHRHYYGLKEMREGELSFLKSTVLSKSNEAVTMCSDMPMEDMSKDIDFSKKWMFGLAAMLKKGLHIRMIHNLNRPFSELMLGLESWIPLYMTGLVEPYYLKKTQNEVYCHLHYTSGDVALIGDCIQGHHIDGHYYITRKNEEVKFYQKQTQYLLAKASPLMKIYTHNELSEFQAFMSTINTEQSPIFRLSTSLPLCTISDDLLIDILEHNQIKKTIQKTILDYVHIQKKWFLSLLEHSTITAEIKIFDKEEFKQCPPSLTLSGLFCSDLTEEIKYTYDEYQQHIQSTMLYTKQYPNLQIQKSTRIPFRNIEILISKGKYVLISKNLHPTIHFVICNPILLNAIQNMLIAVEED